MTVLHKRQAKMVDEGRLYYKTTLPWSRQDVFAYHARPGALQRLLPPWERTEVLQSAGIAAGTQVLLRVRFGPFSKTLKILHEEYETEKLFRERMVAGPFFPWSRWEHTHLFSEMDKQKDHEDHEEKLEEGHAGQGGTVLEDYVRYRLPLHSLLPQWVKTKIHAYLEQTFAARSRVLFHDLALQHRYVTRPLRVVVSGASGMLGRALVPLLTTAGHDVWTLVRREVEPGKKEISWNPLTGKIGNLAGFDAVIHLAGEKISLNRWTSAQKERVLSSRIKGTALLLKALGRVQRESGSLPAVFLSASATGYYGDTGSQKIDESFAAGTGYMANVCKNWETAAVAPLQTLNIRAVFMRFGVVLAPLDGALCKSLTPVFLVRQLGNGKQIISWISLDDAVAAIYHTLFCNDLDGPLNIVAPYPVSNAQFLKELAQVSGRCRSFAVPRWLLVAVFGEMAREIFLSSSNISSKKLLDSGFIFNHSTLHQALCHLLGKKEEETHGE